MIKNRISYFNDSNRIDGFPFFSTSSTSANKTSNDLVKINDLSPFEVESENDISSNAGTVVSTMNSGLQMTLVTDYSKVKTFRESKVRELYDLFETDNFENGYISDSEIQFKKILEESRDSALLIINEIYLEALKRRSLKTLVAILQVLANCKYDQMYPVGPTIVTYIALKNYDDYEIAEGVLKVFAYWNNKDFIDILKELHFQNEWLENYRVDVINEFEGD